MKRFGEMLSTTKDFFESGLEKLSKLFVSDDVAKASMVLAAWITTADGSVDEREVAETEAFIQNAEYLQKLDKEKLASEYRKWCDQFLKDPDDAVVYALTEITPLIQRPEAVNAVQLAYKIAGADQNVTENELKVVTKACHFLGVSCTSGTECVLAE